MAKTMEFGFLVGATGDKNMTAIIHLELVQLYELIPTEEHRHRTENVTQSLQSRLSDWSASNWTLVSWPLTRSIKLKYRRHKQR